MQFDVFLICFRFAEKCIFLLFAGLYVYIQKVVWV